MEKLPPLVVLCTTMDWTIRSPRVEGDSWNFASSFKASTSLTFLYESKISSWIAEYLSFMASNFPFQVSLFLVGLHTTRTSPLPSAAKENKEATWYVWKVTSERSFIFSTLDRSKTKDRSTLETIWSASSRVQGIWEGEIESCQK